LSLAIANHDRGYNAVSDESQRLSAKGGVPMAEQTQSLEEMIRALPPDLQQEVRDFAEFLLEKRRIKPRRKHMRMKWAGALKKYRDQYTSLELQKKALEWWDDEISG
jgi:hypothetical protein